MEKLKNNMKLKDINFKFFNEYLKDVKLSNKPNADNKTTNLFKSSNYKSETQRFNFNNKNALSKSIDKRNPLSIRMASKNIKSNSHIATLDNLKEYKNCNLDAYKSPIINFDKLTLSKNKEGHKKNSIVKNKGILKFFKFKKKDPKKIQKINIFNNEKIERVSINKFIHQTYYMKLLEYNFKLTKSNYFSQLYCEHFNFSFKSLKYIKEISKTEKPNELLPSPKLGKRDENLFKTVIFDLDETLVHCSDKEGGIKINFKIENNKKINAYLFVRPFLSDMLEMLSKEFELILFTASLKTYADEVLRHIDPDNKYFKYKYYRESCIKIKGDIYVKDLRIIDRDIADMVLVDNASYSFGFQLKNGIPIIPFYNSNEDSELLNLVPFIEYLKEVKDIPKYLKSYFKMDAYYKFEELNQLFKYLF